MKDYEAYISTLMVIKNIVPLSKSVRILLSISPCSYLPTVLCFDDIFLNVVVCVAFPTSSLMSTSKTLESVLEFLEVGCFKVIIFFKVSRVIF